MSRRFDALLFDAGGVLVLPDPTVLGPLLAYYGGDPSIDAPPPSALRGDGGQVDRRRGRSATGSTYDEAYVRSVGVPTTTSTEAAELLGRTRVTHCCGGGRSPRSRAALDRLAAAGIPMGVVSNASGQIEAVLAREIVPGRRTAPHVAMRVHRRQRRRRRRQARPGDLRPRRCRTSPSSTGHASPTSATR